MFCKLTFILLRMLLGLTTFGYDDDFKKIRHIHQLYYDLGLHLEFMKWACNPPFNISNGSPFLYWFRWILCLLNKKLRNLCQRPFRQIHHLLWKPQAHCLHSHRWKRPLRRPICYKLHVIYNILTWIMYNGLHFLLLQPNLLLDSWFPVFQSYHRPCRWMLLLRWPLLFKMNCARGSAVHWKGVGRVRERCWRTPKRDPKRMVQRQRKVGNLKERVRRTNPILRVPPKLPLFPPRHVGVRLLQRAPKMSMIPVSPRKLGVPIQSRKGLGRGDLGGTVSYQIKSLDAEAAASFSVAVGLARKMALEAVLQPWFGSKRRLGREMGMEG